MRRIQKAEKRFVEYFAANIRNVNRAGHTSTPRGVLPIGVHSSASAK
jgi:hypothetical protein